VELIEGVGHVMKKLDPATMSIALQVCRQSDRQREKESGADGGCVAAAVCADGGEAQAPAGVGPANPGPGPGAGMLPASLVLCIGGCVITCSRRL
jgi:hypothetical protein